MSNTFSRAGFFLAGYSVKQVDRFLDRAKEAYHNLAESSASSGGGTPDATPDTVDENAIRSVAFDWTRDGYSPKEVDATLIRLEEAFMRRRRMLFVEEHGEQAWMDRTYEEAKVLYPRLVRPAGERFASAHGQGYAKTAVDRFMDHVSRFFDGKDALRSTQVRSVTFPAAKNDAAYDESVVDVYLERLTQILVAVE
ncbi:MAG: cell division protein DivIVA [Actinomycetaceae bacterium]|nr:cell division protein DivIVA [Arcanobacterium sp.]MDD7504514.1 cell division protein DivIVA [Actinomycetaceae bacterium]MDY6142817.1 cell division protein DivIVA [Arcanobacterium sp.]